MPDTTIAYQKLGQGQAILFIQGVGVIGRGWEPQTSDLSRDYTTVSYDNRGIGQSQCTGPITIEAMAADALKLLATLELEKAHVVGHSMGGIIAQQLALDAPGKVSSLCLMCTFARGPQAARITWETLKMGLRTRLGTRALRRNAFLDVILSRQGRPDADPRQFEALVGRDFADSPPILLKQLQAMARHDISSQLHKLEIPTLVLSADEDPIARWQYGEELAGLIPGARFERLKDASHGVTLEQPERINRIIRQHLVPVSAETERPLQ